MSFDQVLVAGFPLGVVGVLLQLWYMRLGFHDLRAAADQPAAVRYFIAARMTSSGTLALIHVLIVVSVALILKSHPRSSSVTTLSYQVAYSRVGVSLLVILSTMGQLVARHHALRR